MKELDKILDPSETVFWEGTPKFLPFMAASFLMMVFGGIFMLVGGIIMFAAIYRGDWFFIFMPHFWVGVGIFFGFPFYRYLLYHRTYYAITDKRAIIQTGVFGRDFQIVDFDQIANAEVNVSIVDQICGNNSGSILISTAGTYVQVKNGIVPKPYAFCNVKDPYEVFKFFKKVSHDVKTDIQFPNKYRPADNPGYKTQVKGK